jgi:hypothetical protein
MQIMSTVNILNKPHTKLFSRYAIGEHVILNLQNGEKIECYVRAIIFTSSKVRYSLQIRSEVIQSTFHNVDSALVEDGDGTINADIVSHDDNYS